MAIGNASSQLVRTCWLVFALLAISATTAACTPFDAKLDSWVGSRIDEKPSKLPMQVSEPDPRGHRVYIERVGEKEVSRFTSTWTKQLS